MVLNTSTSIPCNKYGVYDFLCELLREKQSSSNGVEKLLSLLLLLPVRISITTWYRFFTLGDARDWLLTVPGFIHRTRGGERVM